MSDLDKFEEAKAEFGSWMDTWLVTQAMMLLAGGFNHSAIAGERTQDLALGKADSSFERL